MDKKNLFRLATTVAEPMAKYSPDGLPEDANRQFKEQGFTSAREQHGSLESLKVCLNRIYREHAEGVRRSKSARDKEMDPLREQVETTKQSIIAKHKRATIISEEHIPRVENEIQDCQTEIQRIRENPGSLSGEVPSAVSFIIGIVILVFLSIYLFVFYTSASYSAFFKQFTEQELAVANTIFDAKALTKAYQHGFTELIFIVLMPFIFLGLGFLIHKFQEGRSKLRYLKVSFLIFFTFLFDALLAFEITKKIDGIECIQSFASDCSYTPSDASLNPVFWLIIFAGFLVYVIWGFVFSFVMEEHEKRDTVRLAIRAKEAAIVTERARITDLRKEQDAIELFIANREQEKTALEMKIARTVFVTREFELKISWFMEGWMQWLHANRYESLVEPASSYAKNFVHGLGSHSDRATIAEMRAS